MMRYIYTFVEGRVEDDDAKEKLFLFLNTVVFAMVGFLIWSLAGRFIAPGIEWLLCFILYPMFFVGFIGGVIYLYRL